MNNMTAEIELGGKTLSFDLAITEQDFTSAFTVVNTVYYQAKLGITYPDDLDKLPTTITLMVREMVNEALKKCIGALSLVLNQSGELRSIGNGKSQNPEIEKWILKKPNLTVAEVSMLAIDARKKGFLSLLAMFQVMYLLAKELGVKYLYATVHPDHVSVYKHLGFNLLGQFWQYRGEEAASIVFDMTENHQSIDKMINPNLSAKLAPIIHSWVKKIKNELNGGFKKAYADKQRLIQRLKSRMT